MALTAAQITALTTEIQTDPNGYGYAAMVSAGSDASITAALNLVRGNITVFRGKVETYELLDCLVASDYTGLTQANRDLWNGLMGLRIIDTGASTVRTLLGAIFGAATTTRANLLAKFSRTGSRAEQLFGAGVEVTDEDVAHALGR